jgi:DNA (cytosine-5)-methyltransferase 1
MFKNGELIIDNFAGGGGASTGIEAAFRDIYVDFAANHDEDAIRMHKVNHPKTIHMQEDIWLISPEKVTQGRPVGLLWASPDCTHFSNTAGKRPLSHHIRGLAWNILKWAATVRPRVIIMENVPEFLTWGPLNRGKRGYYDENGEKKFRAGHRPIEKKKGTTFKQFYKQLTGLGYKIEYRTLCAADYGAATIRERFFLIARCDGKPIEWPVITHAERHSKAVQDGTLKPYTPATSAINYKIAGGSVFEMKNGKFRYGDKAMNRIYTCIRKYIAGEPNPNILPFTSSEYDIQVGLLTEEYGTSNGFDPYSPMHTITKSAGAHFKDIRVCLKEGSYRPDEKYSDLLKRECGEIYIKGKMYHVVDILGRNLMPSECFTAQGFPENYVIDRDADGHVYSKTAQNARVGNSVVPLMAKLLVQNNFREFQAA